MFIMAYAMRHQGHTATASGLDVLAGIWLLISPFVLSFRHLGDAVANNVVLGIIIGLLALYRFFSPTHGVWVSWLNVLLGIWVLISPWVLGFNFTSPVARSNNVIMGIIVIILAGWSALATTAADERAMDHNTM
jgi:hypothetical protein